MNDSWAVGSLSSSLVFISYFTILSFSFLSAFSLHPTPFHPSARARASREGHLAGKNKDLRYILL